MKRLFATYISSTIFYANASESLLAMLTPYKYSYNKIVSRNNTVYKLVSALYLADPQPCL